MPLPTVSITAPEVKVSGTALSRDLLDRLSGAVVHRRLRLAARAELRFDDTDFVASSSGKFTPGAVVELSTAEGAALFAGLVTAVELTLERGRPELTVVADDRAVLLGREVVARTYQSITSSSVVQAMAGRYGLRASVTATTGVHPYLLQTTTDLALLDELADREGYDWWVEDKELHFAPPSTGGAAVTLNFGEELADFSVRVSALHPGQTTVTGWDQAQKQPVVGTAPGTFAGIRPENDLAQAYLNPTTLGTPADIASTLTGTQTQAEAKRLAESTVQQWISGAVLAKGRCWISPALRPGGSVKIADAGSGSGTYRVTEVTHSYDRRGFFSSFVCGTRTPAALVDSLRGGGRPSSFRHSGIVVGIVTSVGNGPDKAAAVKVRYPTMGDSVESHWARVATPGAGASRGLTFLPEINDEVIVGFEGGDVRRPVVLGALFNGKDLPDVYGNEGQKITKRRITSRLGHFIELADGQGDPDQAVTVSLAGGQHTLKLAKNGLTGTVPSGMPISLKAGSAELTIGADGGITIQGSTVTIKATSGEVNVSGMSITQKATTNLELSASMATVKANAKAEISSSGITAISGSMVKIN